jgi:preprotein translocase subunit SecD
MQNKYPLWKNLLLVIIVLTSFIYAIPNLFHDDPAAQISSKGAEEVNAQLIDSLKNLLQKNHLTYTTIDQGKDNIIVRFTNTDIQLQARDVLSEALGDKYVVALSLVSRTPKWLQILGANPMHLGLDLRGGVHFLLAVDIDSIIKTHVSGDIRAISEALRNANVRYSEINIENQNNIAIHFRDAEIANQATSEISNKFHDYQLTQTKINNDIVVHATASEGALTKVNGYVIEQIMGTLRNRVNALGVSEALVQQQGRDRISVDLPGMQDTARAKDIIGKVATLKFELVDTDHDVDSALAGNIPIGSKLYYTIEGQPVLLKERVILHGESITYATAAMSQDGRPAVQVRLSGGEKINQFNKVTNENIGKAMAVVYVETKSEQKNIDGQIVTVHHEQEKVISVATIKSALGGEFEITGLENAKYAQNLALLLRSGALSAPISFIEEITVGPSLGAINIHMGLMSVLFGFIFVVLFMAVYYRVFGLLADVALFLNLIFIVAIFSLLHVTMTLPSIAAMVLTVGLAVDANVLIYERIREELRNGVSPQASIHIGYDRALITIIDSNVTTLIVALVLFALGTGIIKGFAVTLIVGVLTSMFTATIITRALVNWIYGSKNIKKLSIGIKQPGGLWNSLRLIPK